MNNKWLVTGLIIAIVVLVAVIAVGAFAFTQSPLVSQAYNPGWMMSQGSFGPGMVGGRGFGRGGLGGQNSLIEIAAKDLNLSATDLAAQLASGKSIADVAKEKNVSTDKIVDDFSAAHSAQLKTAVDSKWLTQAEADAMLALAKAHAQTQINAKGTTTGFGFGAMGPRAQNFQGFRGGGMMGPRGGWR